MAAQPTTKGESFMTTKISQWQRIAMLAAGISTSMVSMGPEPLSDTIGWIDLAVYGDTWYGANAALLVWLPGTPTGNLSLFGGSLNSWTVLDADVRTLAVGATALYDFRNGGAMKQYNGSPDNWLIIDETTKAEAIVAGGGLYQVRRD